MGKIVFVVGGPHSGTTWLCLVLGAHKDAVPIGESYRFTKKFSHLAAHKLKAEAPCVLCKGSCKFWKQVKKCCTVPGMYDYLFVQSGVEFLVDSSKKTDYIDYVQQNVPVEVKIVWIDRNPADAIYHYYARGLDANEHAKKWLRGRDQKKAWLAGKDACVVNYEDAFNIETLQRIGEYIGIEVSEEMYEYWKMPIHPIIGASSAMAPVNEYHKLWTKFKGNNKQFLRHFGYEVKPISLGHKLPEETKRIIADYEKIVS